MGGALTVSKKTLETVLDEVYFLVNLYSVPLPSQSARQTLPSQVSHLLLPGKTTSKTPSSHRHINSCFSVYLFLDSEP